ncbi:MAG: undecaprenyl-phosphate glucose phosphotransferase, partial [Xanthobacteraceae bacterium]
MSEFDLRQMVGAGAAGVLPALVGKPHELSPAARLAASQPLARAYSPIVLAGIVRMIDLALIVAIGNGVYFAYVAPIYGFDWYYPLTAAGIAVLAVLAFQAADIYQVHAFRSPFRHGARLILAWGIVFLLVVTVAFFAQLGGLYSRVWLAGFWGVGTVALVGFRVCLYGLVRHWTREGRLERRAAVVGGGDPGASLIH